MPGTLTTGGAGPRLGEFIRLRREGILASWERLLLGLPKARRMDDRALRDHVPLLLDTLADYVESPDGERPDFDSLPALHALVRLDEGFDLPQLTQEYWFLRDAVVDQWIADEGPLIDAAAVRLLNLAFEQLLSRSISSFVQTRERTLEALDRVSAAALGTGELDRFLPELLAAVLQATPAVDAAAVLLADEHGALQARASTGLDHDLALLLAHGEGQGLAGEVARERRALQLREVSSDPRFEGSALRDSGLRALFAVPLVHQGKAVGVAFMGSRTAFGFSEQDRSVFEAMAHRATSLIVQAQLRAELQRSQQLLQAIVDQSPSAIYVKDPAGRHLLANRAAEQLLGRSRGGLLGKGDEEIWPTPALATRVRSSDERVFRSGRPVAVEEELALPGGVRTYLTVKFPLPDERGHPWALGGISTDITERKRDQQLQAELLRQAEQARASAERTLAELDAVLAAAPVGVVSVDKALAIQKVNPEAARLANKAPEELTGKRVRDFISPEAVAQGGPALLEVLETGRPLRGLVTQVRMRARPEEEHSMLNNMQPVFGAEGEVVGAVMALMDITEQVRANQRLRETLAERQLIADVFERGDACVVTDRDLRVVLVNRNQELLSHTRREETLGSYLWDIFPEAAREESAFSRQFERVLLERVESHFEEFHEPLGRWFDVRAYPVLEGGIAVYFSDITARKQVEQFQERLVGIVSHDLRNPLATIELSARALLQRKSELPPFAASAAARTTRSAERMANMIAQLLDFTRARLAGGIPLERCRTDLCEVAGAVVEELALLHPGRVRLECELPRIEGEWDPQRLAQVLSNLITNGLTHGAADTPVVVCIGREDGRTFASVRNQGPALAPEKIPSLFDPFKRGETHEKGGLGLGLYVAQQIVLGHGGRIGVTSSVEEGTCFTVWLPA